jgi:hypothetical protein
MNKIKQFVISRPYMTAYSIAAVLLAARSSDFISTIALLIIAGIVCSFLAKHVKL